MKVKDKKKLVLPRVDGVQILSVSVNTHYKDSFFRGSITRILIERVYEYTLQVFR